MTATQFLEFFVSVSLQAAAVIVVTAWLCRLTREPSARCSLWTGCHVVLLGLLAAGACLPHQRLLQPWRSLDKEQALLLVPLSFHAGRILLAVWMVGVLIAAGCFAWNLWQARRFLSGCRPIEPARLTDLLPDDLRAQRLREVRYLMGPHVVGPFCWQLHRPFIVLPEFVFEFEPEQIRLILRHELEHLQSGHPLQLFLQRVVEILFWFHPLVRWASRQTALCREFACDDATVQSREEIARYLRTLLLIVEHQRENGALPHAAPKLAFGAGTAARARRLVQAAQAAALPRSGRFRSGLPLTAGLAAAALAGCAASLIWLPADVFASSRSRWSPWPAWTATTLHDFGLSVRDYEVHDTRFELQDIYPDAKR